MRSTPPELHEKGLVKISAVTWGTFNSDESKTLLSDYSPPETTRIRAGDFLLSRANTIELVGACVIVDEVTRPVYLSDKVLRIAMPDEYKRWLLYWLRSPLGRQQIEALATGNQLSMRNLSQANLRAITVRLPSADERKEITRRVENLLMLADRLELRQKTAMSSVDRLTPALLAKAFRGELVPQNANDEPAAELLQRLIKERSGEGETTKRARGRRALTPCAE
jgi:type I restriction enzyme S subunit